MNFKIGDRVVYIDTTTGASYPDYGDCGGVTEIYGEEIKVIFDNSGYSTAKSGSIFAYRFVHEYIFNSPLFQTLKETEENI